MEEYINGTIAPRIRGDGGWIEFVAFEDNVLSVVFRGECSKCQILDRCISWIEDMVKKDLGLEIKIEARRVKPFFWDNN